MKNLIAFGALATAVAVLAGAALLSFDTSSAAAQDPSPGDQTDVSTTTTTTATSEVTTSNEASTPSDGSTGDVSGAMGEGSTSIDTLANTSACTLGSLYATLDLMIAGGKFPTISAASDVALPAAACAEAEAAIEGAAVSTNSTPTCTLSDLLAGVGLILPNLPDIPLSSEACSVLPSVFGALPSIMSQVPGLGQLPIIASSQ
jgi:hypothetical protein